MTVNLPRCPDRPSVAPLRSALWRPLVGCPNADETTAEGGVGSNVGTAGKGTGVFGPCRVY